MFDVVIQEQKIVRFMINDIRKRLILRMELVALGG